jgi:N-acetyl-alpha-D-muramate 1-phosphate uridylyltransferase
MSRPAAHDLSVAILAGGMATRLLPVTRTIPKCMVEVAGRPFIEHQLGLLSRGGFRKIVLCLGHLGEQVVEHVGDGSAFGVETAYSHDGPVPLGTGGALRQALPLLTDPFFVLYGDSYLPTDFRPVAEAFLDADALGCMTVHRNDGRWDRSNVWFEDGRIRLHHKRGPDDRMRHIDYGLGLLRHAAFRFAPTQGPFDLATLYETLVEDGRMTGHEVASRFYEIGSPAGLAELDALLRGPADFS